MPIMPRVVQAWFNAGLVVSAVVLVWISTVAQYRLLNRVDALEHDVSELRRGVPVKSSAVARNEKPSDHAVPRGVTMPAEPLSLSGAATDGSDASPLTVIEFADFRCRYCGEFVRETFPLIKRRYIDTGKVRWAFRNCVLQADHARTDWGAAIAAECANRQGRFWSMHRELFSVPDTPQPNSLREHARRVGLNLAEFDRCVGDETDGKDERIAADVAVAKNLGVSGTPTFLIGTTEPNGAVRVMDSIVGVQPIEQFTRAFERFLVSDHGAK